MLFIGVVVVAHLGVFDVAVILGLVVLLSKNKVLTALPLWRHAWEEAAVLLLPAVVLVLAVGDFKIRLA